MKLIIRVALALAVLCFACAEARTPSHTAPEIPASIEVESVAPKSISPATETDVQGTEDFSAEVVVKDSLSFEPVTIEAVPEQNPSMEIQAIVISEEPGHAKIGGGDETATIMIDHAKTDDINREPEIAPQPEPQPFPEAPADLQTAVEAACAYAISTYGVSIDTALDFHNSAYRFPAAVPNTASQVTLNAKAVDMVDYTFQQQMVLNHVTAEDIQCAGFRCNIVITEENGGLLTYVLYDG